MVRLLLGAVLSGAAALKFQGLSTGALPQNPLLASPHLLLLAIEVEALLGLWLLSGLAQRHARLAGIGFFALLTAISLHQGLTGQRSCGCFGTIHVSPWWTFAFNVAAIASLAWFRPRVASTAAAPPAWVQPWVQIGVGAGAILVVVVGIFLLLHDEPVRALAQLRGEAVGVEPYVTDVGAGRPGEMRTFTIHLTNYTARPVRVVGGTTSCSCVTTKDLPVELPPARSRTIRVEMRFAGSPGRFLHRFVLYTDNEHQWAVVAHFTGSVSP